MKRVLVSSAVLALAIAGIGQASAAPALQKVTGGGQITTDMQSGPGQTLAFNARSFAEGTTMNADGQLQYNPHGAEAAGAKFHGTVTCLVVMEADENMPAMATLAGVYDNGSQDGGQFKLTIMDVDRDGPQNEDEPLTFEPQADNQDCGEPAEGEEMQLGRGNITIHKEKGADDSEAGSASQGGAGKGRS